MRPRGGRGDTIRAPAAATCRVNPRSKFYDEALLERGIGIRFNGQERNNVEEYCLSEGWIRVPAGKALDRSGNPITFKLTGKVEAWIKNPAGDAP